MTRPFTAANALRRALRDLERQASALQSQTTATAEPVASIGFGLPRACVVPAEPLALPGATWAKRWLEPPGDRPSLFAYPGHQAASIQEQPYIGVGYVLNMSAPSEIELAVGTVTALVQEQRNFTPLFICTSTHFVPFLRHGYAFEYLPPRDQFGGDDAAYLLWRRRRRRLAFIAAKWGLSSVTELGAPPTAPAEAQPQLIYFPDYGDSNPYQQIMYADVQESWQVAPGAIETAIAATRRGPTIFHLHWEDAVGRDSADPAAAMATFVRDIDLLRQRGGLFVWTIHNLEPHDAPDPALSRAFAQQLLSRADLVHVHHSSNADDIGGTVGLQTEIITVAHPGYPPSEPVARSAARRQLGLADSETLFLNLGNVRRYKGIEPLLNAAAEIEDLPARFLIAGRATRYDPRLSPPGNCIIRKGHQSDHDVAQMLAAADFMVLPFEDVSTSGSVMLALSNGVPAIVPETTTPGLLQEERECLFFDPDKPGDLNRALRAAVSMPGWKRTAMASCAEATAALYQPAEFSRRIAETLDSLVRRERN